MRPPLLVVLIPLLLTGCDEQAAAEYWYFGTQIAVEACIKRNASSLVDETEIKARCIRKHQHAINPDVITGILAADFNNPYGLNLSASIHDKSNDQIITDLIII
jgi:hypothetical protein